VADTRETQFLTVVRENEARLRRISRVYERDLDARKDLYQEIMFQLWRSLPSFIGGSSIETWVYRVALNTALAHARRRSSRSETTLEEEHLESETLALPLGSSEDVIELDEQSERLHAAIERLDGIDRMLVTMQLDGRSYREMAEVIGITESHVGVKLHRIRKALARSLTEEHV
jgi:RNA polymerase sigma-70 factor (ECF subfamily)